MSKATGPADTRMMGIVHAALKRDLRRARDVLAASPPPEGRQRVALGNHVVWMMQFLHAHHRSEDEGLWPLVRRHNPGAGELLDSLEADHARVSPAADRVAAAAREYTQSAGDPARVVLVAALDDLIEVLVPHLDREVAEAMPVVASSITAAEWDAVEQEHNLNPKSARQLAMEGHWLIEDIDREGYDVVVHKVSTLQRWVLLYGFGPAYRRESRARWTPTPSPSKPTAA